MTARRWRFCAEPGCGERVVKGRCPAHARERDRARGTFRQRHGGLYDARWDRRRKRFLEVFPLCGMRPDGQLPVMSQCHRDGIVTAATDVDHVRPHRGDAKLFNDARGNWQSLCGRCHRAKTGSGL